MEYRPGWTVIPARPRAFSSSPRRRDQRRRPTPQHRSILPWSHLGVRLAGGRRPSDPLGRIAFQVGLPPSGRLPPSRPLRHLLPKSVGGRLRIPSLPPRACQASCSCLRPATPPRPELVMLTASGRNLNCYNGACGLPKWMTGTSRLLVTPLPSGTLQRSNGKVLDP